MKKIILFCSFLILAGCANIRKGEIKDLECRVLGLDASIPIPFAKGVNIMNVRLGWVETKYTHLYDAQVESKVEQKVNYLGTVKRESYIGQKR